MSGSNNEEKVQDASLMEEKVGDISPISYISGDEAAEASGAAPEASGAAAAIEEDIVDLFSSDEEEELLTPALSPTGANLERALTEEVVFGVDEDDESLACSVCYTALDKNNIVNTPCNHVYCWECFFKWVTNSPTCPMCRKNFVSENAWYQNRDVEQDRNDLRELVNIYQREVIGLSKEFKSINMSIKCAGIKLAKVKCENSENMRRLISSRQQISYNDGYIAGQKDVNNNLFKRKFMRHQSNLNTPWFQGYSKAQWEIRYTNRATSGAKPHIPKSIGELEEDQVKEYNKHSMGFKIDKKTEKNTILEEAANTPLPDDSDIE